MPHIILLSLTLLLAGCNPLAMPYKPMSEREQRVFEKADRLVFPEDVRGAPADYRGSMVAWPGIVVKREFRERLGRTEVEFVLEHHYYDWVESKGFEDERILLSRKGEGRFRTAWHIRSRKRLWKIENASDVGSLLIVYGTPESVEDDGTVILDSKYLRVFNEKWYRTDRLDYGRPVPAPEGSGPSQAFAPGRGNAGHRAPLSLK